MGIQRSIYVPGEVIENRAWTGRLFSIKIRAEQIPFKAGQFVRLQLSGDGGPVARSYSLVNAPDEADLEFFYNRVPDGQFSISLASLLPGDSIEVSRPANGFFVLDELPPSRDLWMVATGTGLGPYLSILKTAGSWDRFESVVLVHGVPLREELVYSDLIATWRRLYPDKFSYVSCVTREKNPAGLQGRVTDLLLSGELEQKVGLEIDRVNSHVMLCGNHHMINDMKMLLTERGLGKHLRHKPGQITTEQYF